MTDRHYSLFRGKARSGLGEGPGSQVGLGEQYLDADKELFTQAICEAARPWLTLDAPDQALSERLESWSCFPAKDLFFVSRSVAVRVGFDPRPTYFTHARAFPLSEALGPVDPGAYIGVSAAFDEPWLPGARPPTTPLPSVLPPSPDPSEWGVATSLLAHLYQAFVRKYPVVIVASPGDCSAGGRLFALISYARAALPWSIKRQYRARLFTREPRLFLRQLDAHLLVIPESVAAEALEARREALLLDSKANVVRGPALGREARGYAEALQVSVNKFPRALLSFASRVSAHLREDALPGSQEVLVAQAIYNLSAAGPAQMDSLFWFLLTRLSAEATSPLPFDTILLPAEIAAVSDARMKEALLHGSKGEALSSSAEALLRVVVTAARARGLTLDAEVRAFTEPLPDAQLRKMGWLAREQLLSAKAMAEKTVTLPLARVAEILPVFEALVHERAAGVLGQRDQAFDDLSIWADRDPAVRDLLLDATSESVLGDRWLVATIDRARAEGLSDLAMSLLQREPRAPALTNAWNRTFPRLRALPGTDLRRAHESLLAQVRRTDPANAPVRYVELMILLDACNGLPREVVETWQQALQKIRDPAIRRWIVTQGGSTTGICVDRDGKLLFPVTWDRDVAGLVLGKSEAPARLSLHALSRLVRSADSEGPNALFKAFLAHANRDAAVDLDKATSVLVNEGAWLVWRASTPNAVDPRRRAHAWLAASHASRRDAPMIEEWQFVIQDLGERLDDEDMRLLVETDSSGRARALWPRIAPYENQQLRQLAALAKRLDHLVLLARAIDPARDLKGQKSARDPSFNDGDAGRAGAAYAPSPLVQGLREVMNSSPFSNGGRLAIEPEVVAWLSRPRLDQAGELPYRGEQLRILLSFSGSLQARIVNLAVPMEDQVVRTIAAWLTEQQDLTTARPDFLERLATWVKAKGPLPEMREITPRPDLAAALRKVSPHLVALVDPPRGQAMYASVVQALRDGAAEHKVFTELAAEVDKWFAAAVESRGAHPLHRLADAVRAIPFEDAALHVHGERAFLMACSWHAPLTRLLPHPDSTFPALDVLLVLVPTEDELPPRGDARRAPGCAGAVGCRLVAHAMGDKVWSRELAQTHFWSALFTSLGEGERRTGVRPHRPAASVAEIRRLGARLSAFRSPFDTAYRDWLGRYGRLRVPAPAFPLKPSGARS